MRMILLILLAGLLALTGCPAPGPERGPAPPPLTQPQAQGLATPELSRRAEDAYRRSDHGQALLLNQALLGRQEVRGPQRAQAAERAARSANEMRRYDQAVDFLRTWSASDPAAKSGWGWHETYAASLDGLGLHDLLAEHLAAVSANRGYSQELRANAALALTERAARRGRPELAVKPLQALYSQAPDQNAKAGLERGLLARLEAMPDEYVLPLARPAADGGDAFPRNVMRLAGLERQARLEGQKGVDARRALRDAAAQGQFADPALVKRAQASAEGPREPAAPQAAAPAASTAANGKVAPGGKIALAVPLSGKLADVGSRIMHGAAAAQRVLAAKGLSVDLRAVNTDHAGWAAELAALPPDYRMVGGPLRSEELKELANAGQTRERAVFAFVQSMPDLREGQEAWRFFGSPRDQVNALLDLAAGGLGQSQFGILAPAEPFGQRMSQVFLDEAGKRGVSVAAQSTYPPRSFAEVDGSVKRLVDSGRGTLQAVFLPDTLAQAKMLAPYLHFRDAEHVLLLGPELWSQALAKPQDLEDNYFRLALCPGPWWPGNPGAAAAALRQAMADTGSGEPDFWSALGFDFVRTAVRLGALPEGWSASTVNERLGAVNAADFSLAPISWDSQGLASQQLFVFQPSSAGLKPVDQAALLNRLQQAQARHEERMRTQAEKPPKPKKP